MRIKSGFAPRIGGRRATLRDLIKILIYRLDATDNRSAERFQVRTGELGWFLPAAPWSGLTELEIEGVFFDETTGADSAQPLRLAGLARLPAGQTVRINLFTHLAAARTRALLTAGTMTWRVTLPGQTCRELFFCATRIGSTARR